MISDALNSKISCKNRNDCYKEDSNLAHLFYGKERIKIVPSWQNSIANLFYGRWWIKRHHSQQIFYGRRRIIMRSKKINKQKDVNNETEYEESSVTGEVLRYYNIFEYGRKILNRLGVTQYWACMANVKEKYYMTMVETLIDHNYCHNVPFSNEKLQQSVSKVMA